MYLENSIPECQKLVTVRPGKSGKSIKSNCEASDKMFSHIGKNKKWEIYKGKLPDVIDSSHV